MQIGAMNHPARNPLAEIEWIGRHGFDFIDFTLEPPGADPGRIDPPAVRDTLAAQQLDVVAHTAWYIPLASPFAGIRQAALDELRRSLQSAHAIGARVMNVHFNPLPPAFPAASAVTWHTETLRPLCHEAGELGITVAMEHVPRGGPQQLELFAAILEEVPLLGFHLDSGHAKLEHGEDRFGDYLDRLGHRLQHVHLSDNDGTADQHLPLASAPRSATDWPAHVKKLKTAGYDGTITLEVFSHDRKYLLLSRDLLREWWDAA